MFIFQLSLPHAEIIIDAADQAVDEPHEHKQKYQLLIPLEGRVSSYFNTTCYELEYGKATLKNPETPHWHKVDSAKSIIISWDRTEFRQWSQTICSSTTQELEFSQQQYINPEIFIKQINKWVSSTITLDNPMALVDVQSELFDMIVKLSKGSEKAAVEGSRVVFDDFIQDVMDYIHENYARKITLEDLMAISNQSKYHFIRSFKKSTGYSPYNYVLNVRITKAKELLKNSKMPVQEISDSLCFSSSNHFIRTFLNITGMSPKQYRDTVIMPNGKTLKQLGI